jgi:hypothetical protein
MGLREIVNRQRTTVIVVSVIVTVGALVSLALRNADNSLPLSNDRAFFSTDDGQTYFEGPNDKVPPFEHEGRTAVRALVFRCGKTEWVGFLEQYNREAKQALEAAAREATKANPDPAVLQKAGHLGRSGIEIKKPGEKTWHGSSTPPAVAAKAIQCPEGDASHVPTPVRP